MTVVEIGMENFENEVSESSTPIILDFYADWCGPCQMMKPAFSNLSEEFKGKLKFGKVNTEKDEMLAIKFGIQGLPSLVVVKGDQEVGRIVGYAGEDVLKEKINKILEKV